MEWIVVLQRTKMLIEFKQEKEKLENEIYQIRQNTNEGICTAGLKPTDSCQEVLLVLSILTIFSLYINETILFLSEKSNYITNDMCHAHNIRSSLIIISMHTN
jgi:hypothetical protein